MALIQYQDSQLLKHFEIPDGSNLYFELLKQGTDLKHGCLAGVCGVCRIEILQGHEFCSQKTSIEKDTLHSIEAELIQKGIVYNFENIRLACRLIIKGGTVKFSPHVPRGTAL
jgi:ferredoxin